jgi:hypothetical protein
MYAVNYNTCDLDSEPKSSATSAIVPQGQAPASIPTCMYKQTDIANVYFIHMFVLVTLCATVTCCIILYEEYQSEVSSVLPIIYNYRHLLDQCPSNFEFGTWDI